MGKDIMSEEEKEEMTDWLIAREECVEELEATRKLNGVAKESNIEEDVKFIKEMVKEYNTFGDLDNLDYEDTDKIYKAIENILEEREQDKKRIKELEEKNISKMELIEIIDFAIGATGHNDTYTTGMCNGMKYIKSVITDTNQEYFNCPKQDSIPVQKVKDKIERHKFAKKDFEKEYDSKNYKDDGLRARDFYMIVAEDLIIKALEDLLETNYMNVKSFNEKN